MHERSNVRCLEDGTLGKVASLHATTVTVDWEDGSTSRVNRTSVELHGPQPKAPDPVRVTDFKRIDRRFGDVVKQRMVDLGLTYDDLAQKADLPRRTIIRFVEQGEAPEQHTGGYVATLERLAHALQVAPGDFWQLS